MAHSWMPGARRIRAGTDGGSLRGGAPRAVWLTLGTAPGVVSIQSVATRLIAEGRPCHLIWDPVTGEIAQLVSALRAACALSIPEHATMSGIARTAPGTVPSVSQTARGAPPRSDPPSAPARMRRAPGIHECATAFPPR